VRLRLTVLYGGLFALSGAALLLAMYLIFRANSGTDLIVPHGNGLSLEARQQVHDMFERSIAHNSHRLHVGLIESGVALALMTVASIVLGWLVAGRVLRPLRTMTATTRRISERSLNERLAMSGPRDELKDLADTIDGLLARLEAHVAEQQRFAANASHELRTPLSLIQTLLDVAREDPNRDNGKLVEHLRDVNARAIDLTEALLLLSHADRRSFTREDVDLSLMAEEATETLLPLAERNGVSIETSGDVACTVGSRALLLQLTTNLLHNAIVHNLPEHGSVWVTTSAHPDGVELTVENTGEQLSPELVSTLVEPFQRGTERVHADQAGAGLGLAIVKSIAQAHDGRLTIAARSRGGLHITVRLPTPPLPGAVSLASEGGSPVGT
jgi:two-component system sensor histidine kinase VanS